MPAEQPIFSSKTIEEVVKKKIIRRRRPISKPTIKKIREKNIQTDKMAKQLNSIYQDTNGNMPNMKRIKVKKGHPIIKFLFSLIVVGGLLAAIAWAGFFVLPGNNNFSEDKVQLVIQGTKNITLGATTTYIISYNNNQATKLANAILTIQYPNGFVFKDSNLPSDNSGHTEWKLGTVKPNEKRDLTITGLTYGSPNNEESWRVFLNYKPEKFNYNAQKMATLNITLDKSPFSLSASGPDKAILGNDVEYKIKITNKDKNKLGDLTVSPKWTTRFFITTSTPAMDKNNNWIIDTSTSTYNWELLVKGRYASTTEKIAKTSFTLNLPLSANQEVYQLDKKEIETKLEQNNLKLGLVINGKTDNFTVQPGDSLSYNLYLKNSGSDDLKNLKVSLQIDGPSYNNRSVMDWANIKDKYDGDVIGTQISPTLRRGEVIWSKTQISEMTTLIPNDDISIDATLGIRDINQFDLTQLKNSELEVSALASYTDKNGDTKSLAGNPIKIIINSDLKLEVRDTKSTQDSKEQHVIQWILTNNFHDLKDITLSADVYGKTKWQLEGKEPAGKAQYNTSTQNITWKIDKMPLTVDTLALPFSITILENNPSQQILVSKIKVEAIDTITNQKINLIGNEIKLK